VDGGTYVRERKSNRQLNAAEITELSLKRGSMSIVNALVDVPFELLDTIYWKEYRDQRKLTRPTDEALSHLGLARKNDASKLVPTRAAVLLFAEEPSGLLDSKCSIRIFHYKGDSIEHKAQTILMRPPKTIGGPLKVQITGARETILDALSTGVQVGPLGFEIVQKYPVRVITEAITNAVIHRDYRLPADIHIRIFANRIEVESPGVFPGNVTVSNIGVVGSHPRNRALVDHLREFPNPPNLDAGEGVRMMQHMMGESNLYPPIFLSQPDIPREAVIVFLFNELRPSVWDQIYQYLLHHEDIGNTEVRKILRTDNIIKASKMLANWVKLGLLVLCDAGSAKKNRRYRLPGVTPSQSLFSQLIGK
jgi:ATP-dependent DNA helicase RecG